MCPDAEQTVFLGVEILDLIKPRCLGKVTLHGVAKTWVIKSDQVVRPFWEADLPPSMELAVQNGHLTRLGQRIGQVLL